MAKDRGGVSQFKKSIKGSSLEDLYDGDKSNGSDSSIDSEGTDLGEIISPKPKDLEDRTEGEVTDDLKAHESATTLPHPRGSVRRMHLEPQLQEVLDLLYVRDNVLSVREAEITLNKTTITGAASITGNLTLDGAMTATGSLTTDSTLRVKGVLHADYGISVRGSQDHDYNGIRAVTNSEYDPGNGHLMIDSNGGNLYLNWHDGGEIRIGDGGGVTRVRNRLYVDDYLEVDYGIAVGAGVSSTYAIYATGRAYGIRAFGTTMGGRFEDPNSSGRVYCGYGGYDIYANGGRSYIGNSLSINTTTQSGTLYVNGWSRANGVRSYSEGSAGAGFYTNQHDWARSANNGTSSSGGASNYVFYRGRYVNSGKTDPKIYFYGTGWRNDQESSTGW